MGFVIRYLVFTVVTSGLLIIPEKIWNTHLRWILVGYFLITGVVFML